jgi:light-regulated signal transduction histidine kinase (bacteriophytochrome)
LTLTPTDGGTPIVLPDFVSGTEISNLLGSTSYTISLKTLGGVSNINSLPAIVEFTTSQDPVEVARLAELARVEAARLAELARLAAIAQAKTEIQAAIKAVNGLTLDMLAKAEIKGATKSNLPQINKELAQLSPEKRGDLKEILRVIRKFEVLDILASSDTSKIQSRLLIEIGLIPSDSDNKTSLMNAVRRLSPVDRSTYEAIQSAIKLELQGIQARKDRTAAILKKIKNR